MRGPKQYSATYPKASQLTQSEYLGQLYDLIDRIDILSNEYDPVEDTEDILMELSCVADEARTLGEECQEKSDNMPESLQYGPTGELLQQRADAMETWADELEQIEEEELKEGNFDIPQPDVE